MNLLRKMPERKNCGDIMKAKLADSHSVDYYYDNYMLDNVNVYPEHDNEYLEECLQNLKNKGIEIKFEK